MIISGLLRTWSPFAVTEGGEKIHEGVPKTEEERKARHKEIYGTEDVPERGTGKNRFLEYKKGMEQLVELVVIVMILVLLYIIFKGGI